VGGEGRREKNMKGEAERGRHRNSEGGKEIERAGVVAAREGKGRAFPVRISS
jgi:hypothetical protein